jgi:polyhydroxybutyrate depolymerase
LVLFLHGLGASGKVAFEVLRLRELGERKRAFIVAPDGAMDSRGQRFWNAHSACCNFDRRPLDDVARLRAVVDKYAERGDVDPDRIYAVGLSNGGFMVHRLACKMSDRLAAVVSIAGAGVLPEEDCPLVPSIAVLEIHGDADEVVRYQGGTVFDQRELAPHGSAQSTLRDWGRRLHCQGPPTSGSPLDLDPKLPGAETRVDRLAACSFGASELWTVQGGNHFSGSRSEVLEAIWTFLEHHPKRR